MDLVEVRVGVEPDDWVSFALVWVVPVPRQSEKHLSTYPWLLGTQSRGMVP